MEGSGGADAAPRKTAKAEVKAKLPAARKSRKNDGLRARDLETRLADAVKREAEALERQTATAEILRAMFCSPKDFQPVFDAIVRNGARLCEAFDAVLILADGDEFVDQAHHGPMETLLGGRYPLRGDVGGRAVLEARVVQVENLAEAADYPVGQAMALRVGYRTTLSVPLLRGGSAIGAITLRRTEVMPFSDRQIALLQPFADQAVIAIENVRLFTELEARNHDLTDALARQTATAEVQRVISRSQTDTRPVFAAIMDCVVRLCAADLGSIFAVEGGRLVPIELWPSSPEAWAVLREVYPRPADKTSLTGRAVVEARVVHVPDIEAPNAPPVLRSVPAKLGFRSQLSVPILRDGQSIGVLSLTRRAPGPFSAAQIELVQTFADQAVIAIENSRLLGELQARTAELTRSVGQLTALGEVGRAVASTPDLETVLTTIVSRAVDLSGLDGGVVFEYDEETEEFVHRAATETGGPLAEARRTTRVRKGEGALGRTAITLEPVQVPDITVPGAYESRLRRNLIESGIRAILVVPMVREGQLIGCLGVTRNHPGEFPAETIALLRTFATQSALAIHNARLLHELADKGRQLEEASRHKTEFLANMSPEPRTPLNAVIGFSEVLLQQMFGALNDKQDEYLKDIYASGQHLLSLINDILDLAKIEAGRMELVPAPFHLPTALENAVSLVREGAARHGITLRLDVDPRLDELVGDERKVKQVLLNLLSNAVKFTPEGGRINLKAGLTDGAVEVAVSDTGIGIAPGDQATIFEEFRQVGHDERRKQEGTGLGLTLAKKFVELHGGKIWVESDVGQGSTFTLPVS